MSTLPKTIAFDFDGTLANTLPWFDEILSSVAQKYNFRDPSAEEKARLRSMEAGEILQTLQIPFWKAPAILMEFRQRMQDASPDIELFDSIPEALQQLHAKGYKMAILSSNSELNVRQILKTNVAYFDEFMCGTDLFGKPAKLGKLLEKHQLSPAECLLIGDELRDIEAAQKAKVMIGSVTWGYNSRDALQQEQPNFLFTSPMDIVKALT
ncbi:HAD-IA family hydrolase [Advenella sp. RU8]|uniref:HAD-IA family hydrolase n=1 Tax=Advenella sp. RU8 TaxID=3399575 RepID=UPI003AAAC4C9